MDQNGSSNGAKSTNQLKKVAARLFCVALTMTPLERLQAETDNESYAFKLYQRIVGIQPSTTQLDDMTSLLRQGKTAEALDIAIESDDFYQARLVPWIKHWFNEEETNRVALNDSVATVIGVIRDDLAFNSILTDDILYVANPATNISAASPGNNDHYQQIEARGLSLKSTLMQTTQSAQYQVNQEEIEIAGVFTTRAFAEAFYVAGTNRAAFKAAMKNFLCKEMEELNDTSTPTFRIRQDVTRAPAGEPETFVNSCQGCHAGMDALSGAFVHFDFRGGQLRSVKNLLEPNNPNSRHKYHSNSETFADGYRTIDDSWINLWSEGQNAKIGWRGPKEGRGIKQFGALIGGSRQFATCMTEQVYELLCLNLPQSKEELEVVSTIATNFEKKGAYSMKQIFRDTALHCVERK